METNGRNSCTGNSRHIDVRYFFVKDRVDKGEFNIGYCNTEDMLADFFTKPLQGRIYRKFRDLIMGYVNIPERFFDINKIKERVGICTKYKSCTENDKNVKNRVSENKDLVISNNIKNNVRTVDLKSKNVNTGNKAYVQTENNGFSNIGNRKDSDNKENTNQLDSKGTYENTVSTYTEKKIYAAEPNEIISKDKKTDKNFLKINKKVKEKNKSENTVQVDGNDKN